MSKNQTSDENRPREELIQELAALRVQLAAEKALRNSEESYRSFFHANHAVMLLIDPSNGHIVNANEAACNFYGYALDEMTNLYISDLNALTGEQLPIEMTLAESHHGRHFFFTHRLSDGRLRDVEVFSGPIYIQERRLLFSIVYDITERKQAEKALREAERKYRELLHHAPAAIFEIDFRKLRFRSVNDAMCHMSGYSREELLRINPLDILDPEGRARLQARVASWLNGAAPERHIEYRMKRKDGRVIDALLDASFTRDKDGKPFGATVVGHDITGRKQEERRIGRYNSIVKGINRIFRQVIRAETEESLGNTCLAVALEITGSRIGFIGEMGPDGMLHDIAISDMGWRMCRMYDPCGHRMPPRDFMMNGLYGRVVDEGKSFYTNDLASHPASVGLPEGHPPVENFLGVPLIHQGRAIGLLAVANRKSGYADEQLKDLEALSPAVMGALLRKRAEQALIESEERLRLATEAADMYGWEVDLSTRAFQWTKNAEKILNVSMPETLTEIWESIHPEDLAEVKATMGTAAEEGGEFKVEYRVGNRTPGEELWLFSAGVSLTEGKGSPTRVVGVTQNITQRKQIEQDLRKLNETLEQKVAERTELAETRAKQLQALAVDLIEAEERERQRIATLLHDDLQQLLAAGRMQLQTACEHFSSDPLMVGVDRLLEEAIQKSRRLSHELSPPVLYHTDFIAALQWLVVQMGEQFGLRVELEAEAVRHFKDPPLKVLLFRAVQELLFNIVKHAGVKSARVDLANSDRGFVITVSDKGCGFDPGIMETSDVKSGLGLVSLRERILSVGGSLVIKSAPGKGSHFTLSVPFCLAEVKRPQRCKPSGGRHSRPPKALDASPVKDGIRVLFVDDHKVMRQGLIQLVAGQPGIEVAGEAANGRQALELARQLNPEVIIMDVSMPEMNGVEATRLIKAEMPGVRVIGLSMFEEEHIARTMRRAGAEALVSKTASSTELLKAIYGIDREGRDRSGESSA